MNKIKLLLLFLNLFFMQKVNCTVQHVYDKDFLKSKFSDFDNLESFFNYLHYISKLDTPIEQLKLTIENEIKYYKNRYINNEKKLIYLILTNLTNLINNKPLVSELINILKNQNINIDYVNNDPVLIFAIKTKDYNLVKVLLNYYDANIKDFSGIPALIWSIKVNSIEILKLLIASDADVNIQADDNSTALMWACNNCQFEMAKILLEKGADTNVLNKEHYSAFTYAIRNQDNAIIELLQKYKKL